MIVSFSKRSLSLTYQYQGFISINSNQRLRLREFLIWIKVFYSCIALGNCNILNYSVIAAIGPIWQPTTTSITTTITTTSNSICVWLSPSNLWRQYFGKLLLAFPWPAPTSFARRRCRCHCVQCTGVRLKFGNARVCS